MGQQRSSALEGLLSQFSAPTPGALQGVNSFLSESREGGLPGFEDIFQNFEEGLNKRVERQAAGLRESFGSQGARFGSDLLRAESDLRSGAVREAIAGAAPLRAAQAQEVGVLGSLALGSAEQQRLIDEAGFNRLFADFMLRQQPPPLLEGLVNFALGIGGPAGQPTTVIA